MGYFGSCLGKLGFADRASGSTDLKYGTGTGTGTGRGGTGTGAGTGMSD